MDEYMYPPLPRKQQPTAPKKKRNMSWQRLKLPLLVALALVIGLIPGMIYFAKYQHATSILDLEGLKPEQESKVLVERLNQKILLPADEEPTVATVSNSNKLNGQVFFTEAENGDKVLVYATAKKVVLYRPSIDRIINVSLLNVSSGLTEEAQ